LVLAIGLLASVFTQYLFHKSLYKNEQGKEERC